MSKGSRLNERADSDAVPDDGAEATLGDEVPDDGKGGAPGIPVIGESSWLQE